MFNDLLENPAFIPVLIAILGIIADVVAGVIPDHYLKYVGVIRRIIRKIMENKNAKLSLMLAILIGLVGCASFQTSDVCETEQPSLICEKITNPESKDLILQIANARLLKEDAYSVSQAMGFLDACENYIDGAVTYADVTKWISSRLGEINLEVLILSRSLDVLSIEAPIYEYDRMLLKEHIQNQREVIEMYAELEG